MSITDQARQILSAPRQDRLAMIDKHTDPEALKAEILRLWTKHRALILHVDRRRFTMIPDQPMTLDEGLEHARSQFGAERVDGVYPMNGSTGVGK